MNICIAINIAFSPTQNTPIYLYCLFIVYGLPYLQYTYINMVYNSFLMNDHCFVIPLQIWICQRQWIEMDSSPVTQTGFFVRLFMGGPVGPQKAF